MVTPRGSSPTEATPAIPSVDVVVVTRDTRELTLRCVDSVLLAKGEALQLTCTVVDNASSDGTAEAIDEAHPEVSVLRNQENRGYGESCNQGLAGGTSE